MSETAARTFEVRHVQLARAFFAAIAAIMITFTPDHSAPVGLSVFSGFAMASGIVLLLAAWLVRPGWRRAPSVLLGTLTIVAGMIGGLGGLRTTTVFFVLVIAWAVVAGVAELVSGLRARRRGDAAARDGIFVGGLTILLAVGLLLVNPAYSLEYFIKEAGATFTLTGISIGVGIFGAYAAVLAVYLGIAGFSPRAEEPAADDLTASAGESA